MHVFMHIDFLLLPVFFPKSLFLLEPMEGFEPPTRSLQGTIEKQ